MKEEVGRNLRGRRGGVLYSSYPQTETSPQREEGLKVGAGSWGSGGKHSSLSGEAETGRIQEGHSPVYGSTKHHGGRGEPDQQSCWDLLHLQAVWSSRGAAFLSYHPCRVTSGMQLLLNHSYSSRQLITSTPVSDPRKTSLFHQVYHFGSLWVPFLRLMGVYVCVCVSLGKHITDVILVTGLHN